MNDYFVWIADLAPDMERSDGERVWFDARPGCDLSGDH